LTAASAIFPPELSAPRADLARLCRQICIQFNVGHATPADTGALDRELADALAAVRARHGDASIHENDLLDVYRSEQLRVADATLLAELLAPKIAAHLRTHGSLTPNPTDASRVNADTATPSRAGSQPRPSLSASSTLPAAPAGPPNIADLLDGMLEQDRHEERTRRTGPRR
jgi:hypothetical protein